MRPAGRSHFEVRVLYAPYTGFADEYVGEGRLEPPFIRACYKPRSVQVAVKGQ